ncbi:MAG TPA: tetratricopeptide repeat protein [Ktedonobacteraceae bacterium]|nr:tetratricopeptide repeat protein [Ktedonobacteraceae bacterium]
MELMLDLENGTLVRVLCDQQFSHTFDLRDLALADEEAVQAFLAKPDEYGKKLYTALFPRETVARRTFESKPDRLLLVALQEAVDAIPWEYTYGLYGRENQADDFLVLSLPFVRGLPPDQRRATSVSGEGLHIIAVPSSPLSRATEQLPIERDWTLLQEVIEDVPRVVTLERCRPPTLKRLRELIANQAGRVIHFIGHGGQREEGAILCFEQENGDLDAVTTQQLLKRLQETAFLVTLSACESAASGPTTWNNVAASLARQGVPYALGMRLSVYDVDARTFFRSFYSELARGSSVEQALFQARLVLAEDSPRRWVIGVPVLYTSLAVPAAGSACQPGTPVIKASDPLLNVDVLPPTDGPFQGRLEELVKLGTVLTNPRPALLFTIHGAGGQGKTALARQAAERFAWAWPGGVWALSLETAQTRAAVVQEMARLLGLETQGITDRGHLENLVQQRLQRRRTLFLLDNAETLLDALQHNSAEARVVVAWLKHLLSKQSTYLVTSRELLTWPDEQYLELPGLQPDDGATLFLRCATPRANEADRAALRALSHRLDGHPLSLRLLARVFGETQQSLEELLASAEAQLVQAHDTYLGPEHRHYKLYACIEVSVRALEPDLRAILSALWIFHTPFLAQTAIAVLDPETEETEEHQSAVRTALHQLWKRSLLTSQTISVRDGSLHVYALLPTTRPYIEAHLEQSYERSTLLSRFGQACFSLTRWIYHELNRGSAASTLTQHIRVDLDRGWQYIGEEDVGQYLCLWGWILYRLGSVSQGLERLELALEQAQEGAKEVFANVLSFLAEACRDVGQMQRALGFYEQALPILREVGNRRGEAMVLNGLAVTYHRLGQVNRPLEFYEQCLQIFREVDDRGGEASTLNNMAGVYCDIGQPHRALAFYEEVLPILRSVEDRRKEAITLCNLARVYNGMGETRRALEYYKQSLPILKAVSDQRSEAAALNGLAATYYKLGETKQALEFYEQTLLVRRAVEDQRGEATTLANLAGIYCDIGQVKQASELYQRALLLSKEVENRLGEAQALNGLATIHHRIGEIGQALEFYEQALLIRQAVKDREGEANTLLSLALVYDGIGQSQRATGLCEQALPILQEIGDREEEAIASGSLAQIYARMGQTTRALELYEQALSLFRKEKNRQREAKVLNDLAVIYRDSGQAERALELYEQALPILREVGNREEEATVLNGQARIYRRMGQIKRALELYTEVLFIFQGEKNRLGEASALNNLALVYGDIGEVERAVALYEQALPICREVGNRGGEAEALNGLATIYYWVDQAEKALELYKQALPIRQEIKDRKGEAATLNNLALVYLKIDQPQRALELYEQALPIRREVGDRGGEATTLNNLAGAYRDLQHYAEALATFDASIQLAQEIRYPAVEIAGLTGRAVLLYEHFKRSEDALRSLDRAWNLFHATGLPRDAGGRTIETVEHLQSVMRQDNPVIELQRTGFLPAALQKQLIENTIAILSFLPEQRLEWVEQVNRLLTYANSQGATWQQESELFTALLLLLDEKEALLPPAHTYLSVLEAIRQGRSEVEAGVSSALQEILQAVHAFLEADDWSAAKRVVEARREWLFRPETEQFFLQSIDQARQTGEEQTAEFLEDSLDVLRACQRDGIEPTFASLLAQTDEQS